MRNLLLGIIYFKVVVWFGNGISTLLCYLMRNTIYIYIYIYIYKFVNIYIYIYKFILYIYIYIYIYI